MNGVALVPATNPTHEVNTAFHPRLPRYDSYVQNTERLGVAGSLQFRPGDATSLSLDVLFSQADTTRDEAFMQAALNNNGFVAATNISNYSIRDAAIVSATLTNATLISERRHDELAVDFDQTVLSFEHVFNDRFSVNALVGSADSKFDNPVQRYVILQKNGDFSYDMNGADGAVFASDPVAGPERLDHLELPQARAVHAERARRRRADIRIRLQRRADAERRRDQQDVQPGHEPSGHGDRDQPGLLRRAAAQSALHLRRRLARLLGGAKPRRVRPAVRLLRGQRCVHDEHGLYTRAPEFVHGRGKDRQRIRAARVRVRRPPADSRRRRRALLRDGSELDGYLEPGSGHAQRRLPIFRYAAVDLNVVFELTDELLLRFGYAEVINRPGMQALRPVAVVSVAGSNRTVTGNNPGLGPTLADTYDLSAEWYFAEESVLALALFQKDIGSFVQTIVQNVPYTDTGLPLQQAIDACNGSPSGCSGRTATKPCLGTSRRPATAPAEIFKGYELSYQQPFSFFDGFASNFGLMANYTYVDSKIDYLGVVGGVTTIVHPDEALTNCRRTWRT